MRLVCKTDMITSASDFGKLCVVSLQILSMLIILTQLSLSVDYDKRALLKTDMLCNCSVALD